MWWKILGVVPVLYTLIGGMVVPLKSGIQRAETGFTATGADFTTQLYGYNSFFTEPTSDPIRVWLTYNDEKAVLAKEIKVINDTILEASFKMPSSLPEDKSFARLNIILDHPTAGTSLLPAGIEIKKDSTAQADTGASWTSDPVKQLHVQKGFSFPYQNVIYESIRNTYYHVPMWFALMFLFIASVWQSIKYLRIAAEFAGFYRRFYFAHFQCFKFIIFQIVDICTHKKIGPQNIPGFPKKGHGFVNRATAGRIKHLVGC